MQHATYVAAVNHDTSTVTLSTASTADLLGSTTTTTGTKVTFLASSHTSGTTASGGTSLVVADATNIAVGDRVYGTNMHGSARVTAISGTTVTLSNGATAAVNGDPLSFVDIEGLGVASTATQATVGATTIVVAAATNIQVGDVVEGTGITAGTTVTGITGTTITISAGTTAAIPAGTNVTFLPADSETLTVGSTSGFTVATAAAPGKVKIGDEIITYTGMTATTLTGITRGADNSESNSIAAASVVSLYDSLENLGLAKRYTDVATALTSTATTLTVDSTADFEGDGFIRIGNEVLAYTGKTATSFTGLTRGAGGTTAAAHTVDAVITQEVQTMIGLMKKIQH